ncbi:hypothetical protein O8C85_02605 [Aliarcobacter butzleri]|uniref:hypothetical protein n=1 Tax=Aliarcobacter butzleri TaxID=28197 RepID=UPI00263C318E|nr:hypothetical protein [Aliarcobacter butzleri]MDN5097417.1 hypothetical protein [Aliarcobacter butzleri]
MYKEISKELKASLFYRIKSPFFSSFLIGILIFNYRYILVLLSTKSIEEKFNFIDTYRSPIILNIPNFDFFCIEYIYLSTLVYPFLFASIWIAIIPFFERYISVPIWKWHQNRLKIKYAELEKEEILLGSERDKYLNEILNIRKDKNKLVEELVNIDLTTQVKIDNAKKQKDEEFEQEKEILKVNFEIRLKTREEEINKSKNEEFKKKEEEFEKVKNDFIKEKEELINKYRVASKNFRQLQNENAEFKQGLENIFRNSVENTKNEIKDLKEENTKLKSELFIIKDTKIKRLEEFEEKEKENNRIFELQKKEILKDFSKDIIKILEVIYKKNIKDNMSYSNFIDEIQEYAYDNRMNLEKILEDLIEIKLIAKDNGGYIHYTKAIKDLIYSAFKDNN